MFDKSLGPNVGRFQGSFAMNLEVPQATRLDQAIFLICNQSNRQNNQVLFKGRNCTP